MSTKYLGNQFDIHGGGMDLKFPHHECEIAQGKGCNGIAPVNYWMHANMLTLNGLRMSKSSGNFVLPDELMAGTSTLFEKAFHPSIIRFCFMQAHYRSVLDLSNEALLASEKGLARLMDAMKLVQQLTASSSSSLSISDWVNQCYDAMNDDFNTPILLAHLFEGVKYVNLINDGKEQLNQDDLTLLQQTLAVFVFDVLGIENDQLSSNATEKLDGTISLLIQMRNEARTAKNFALSDQIRDQLIELGIQLKDGKDGTSFSY
jgi:cysteinyl-tRNA synthetase